MGNKGNALEISSKPAPTGDNGGWLMFLNIKLMLRSGLRRWALGLALGVMACCAALMLIAPDNAWASLQDDRFDGNIFALYAGNGSLVPPRVKLSMSIQQKKPALLLYYLDDSSDCKRFVTTYSQLQAGYGRAADFIPISADTVTPHSGSPGDESYYYGGQVPQLVVIDQAGKVALDEVGQVAYETIDDRLREIFDLLPRDQSEPLRRRYVNEVNTEIMPNS